MILVDANLLIYASIPSMHQHAAAKAWLDVQLCGTARVGLPWPSLLSFLRLVTNPRIFSNAVPITSAWKQIETWLKCRVVWVPAPTDRHCEVLAPLMAQIGGGSRLVPDAHLAALAMEHGLTLCTADGDFARFSGLQWQNPLTRRG